LGYYRLFATWLFTAAPSTEKSCSMAAYCMAVSFILCNYFLSLNVSTCDKMRGLLFRQLGYIKTVLYKAWQQPTAILAEL
jgi:hypothetical protein